MRCTCFCKNRFDSSFSIATQGSSSFVTFRGIAKDSTALHVAAWKAWRKTVKLLIERCANVTRKTQKAEHR
jgi:hypothetical protein